ALARPVWVAVPRAPDWRWMVDREDTPWYPTMRLFRQGTVGRWDDVFARMAGELARLPPPQPRAVSARIDIDPGELLDRIALLEVKKERADDARRDAVAARCAALAQARDQVVPASEDVTRLA